jgi:4-hydroxy-tetrahydrodipicolinate reductase
LERISHVIRVCIAGATGWAGSELARAVGKAADLSLVSAVSRTHAGRTLGHVLNEPGLATPIFASVADALAVSCDVVVEYTKPDSAKANILAALEHRCHVVVGTSGLAEDDFAGSMSLPANAGVPC